MKRHIIILLCITLHHGLTANTIQVFTNPWPPYVDRKLAGWGFTTEIINEAFTRAGYNVIFALDDWKSCLDKGATGEYEIVSNATQTFERSEYFVFSLPYTLFQPMLISKIGSDIEYNTLNDLKPYKIALVEGYANSKAFDEADYLNKIELSSDLAVLKALINDEVDLAVMDRILAVYLINNNSFLNVKVEDLEFIEPPLKTATIHVMFSKARDGYYKKLEDFNNGLVNIFEDGTYDKILKKHGISGSYYDLFEVDK